MKKDFDSKELFIPLPVLLIGTYDKNDNPNIMTAAWGTLHDYGEVFLCLSSNHKTTENILTQGCFTVSFANKDNVVIADYFGIASGNDVDKIKKTKLKYYESQKIHAPLFDEFQISLECKTKSIENDGSTTYLVAEIINVVCDDAILTDGKIDISKLNPIVFDSTSNSYFTIGNKIANAFSVGKKVNNE